LPKNLEAKLQTDKSQETGEKTHLTPNIFTAIVEIMMTATYIAVWSLCGGYMTFGKTEINIRK
jgi:hypothetical protein